MVEIFSSSPSCRKQGHNFQGKARQSFSWRQSLLKNLMCRLVESAVHTLLSEEHREVAHRIVQEAAANF